MEKILEIQNLNKSFGKKKVLTDVSFDIKQGEILGFIGPNGAGKTTTIKIILGLQKIDSGKILINGYDIQKNFEKAIEKVGSIVENPDSYMYLTGMQNLKLIANLYNVKQDKIDELVKTVGLENRINDKVSKYSLGMRQRLGIAIALVNTPNLLILDEPTNGLDPEGIKELRELLVKLAKKQKIAILISSHNLAELESFCTNVCMIQNGKIVASESMEKVWQKKTYIVEVNTTKGIKKFLGKDDKILENNCIEVSKEKEEISDFIKLLLDNDFKVYSLKQEVISLEEAFLEKTGGNSIE